MLSSFLLPLAPGEAQSKSYTGAGWLSWTLGEATALLFNIPLSFCLESSSPANRFTARFAWKDKADRMKSSFFAMLVLFCFRLKEP